MKRALVYIQYGIFLAIVIFLYLFNNHPVTLCILLITVLLPLLSVIAFLSTYRKVHVAVSVSMQTIGRGVDNAIIFRLTNETLIPQPRIYLHYRIFNDLNTNDLEFISEVYVGPRESSDYKIPIKFSNCGDYHVVLTEYECKDLFGFLHRTIKTKDSAEAFILPSEINFAGTVNLAGGASDDETVIEVFAKGNDTSEIFEIRDYRIGDRPQQIHWKLSAKEQELMVKEFSDVMGESYDILLCDDYSDSKQLDAYYDLVYSIGLYLVRSGCAFSYCAIGENRAKLERVHVSDEDKVRECIISMYFRKQSRCTYSDFEALGDFSGKDKHIMLITTQSLPSQLNGRQLYNHNNLAKLYSV